MRRRGLSIPEDVEVFGRGHSGKSVVGPVVVEPMGEGVDVGPELVEAMGQIVAAVELVAPGGLGALDAAVEIGPFGRHHEEFELSSPAFVFEFSHELRAYIDLDSAHRERSFGDQLVEQRRRALRR
jgi:hypothetical protein